VTVYVLVLEIEGYEFLAHPADLWRAPRLTVRRGGREGEVWLDEEDISFLWSRFPEREEERILALVQENVDDLLDLWAMLRNDARWGRLPLPDAEA
jgi:hypothetical protein